MCKYVFLLLTTMVALAAANSRPTVAPAAGGSIPPFVPGLLTPFPSVRPGGPTAAPAAGTILPFIPGLNPPVGPPHIASKAPAHGPPDGKGNRPTSSPSHFLDNSPPPGGRRTKKPKKPTRKPRVPEHKHNSAFHKMLKHLLNKFLKPVLANSTAYMSKSAQSLLKKQIHKELMAHNKTLKLTEEELKIVERTLNLIVDHPTDIKSILLHMGCPK